MLRSRYTMENEYYEVDEHFVEQITKLPPKVALDIAKQIDREIQDLPEVNGWSQRVAGVSDAVDNTYFFLIEYLKQIEEKPVFLDCEIIESDEYLDYFLEDKAIKLNQNDRQRSRTPIKNNG